MDNTDITELKPKYDWDAIVVGDYRLDHSENFFAANKENRSVNIGTYASTPLTKLGLRNGNFSLKEMEITSLDEVEIVTANEDSITNVLDDKLQKEEGQLRDFNQVEVKNETIDEPSENKIRGIEEEKLQGVVKNEPLIHDDKMKIVENKTQEIQAKELQPSYTESESSTGPSPKPKLKLEWSIMQPASAPVHAAVAQPKAYGFKDVYQSKRNLALRQREEEERKAREFHSRPMPNFKILHKRLEDVQVVHHITVPKTPETLKTWYADAERRKQKEQLQHQQEKTQPLPRHALHQQRSHSQPQSQVDGKKTHHLNVKPFNLRSDQRVRDRREYDAAVQVGAEQKKKEQDEQRKQRELEEIKEIRKMTEFKARPNPFK
ncbi:inner centromere protein isoform X2 [Drosophila willistoni]|uniref:inner centromere protein isoform X2 n=1 Tax=Drosophila willistoni TaxID=7260 RepID=UPI000C26D04B|nr:inner centromere protein isoform X2 [Drosophila willistoni]